MTVEGSSATPKPAPRAVLYAYPWALHAMAVDRTFEALRACGIDAVQVALSYHLGTYLTPGGTAGRVRFGDHGALHFDALASLPDGWPFPPIVADAVQGPAYFGSLLRAAQRRGLGMVAWVVYLHNHALARARPELAVRNVYGDVNEAQLCPANPAVRGYALALTRAVLAVGCFDGFHVEALAYMAYDHGFLNPKAAVVPRGRARLALSLCFCGHCREAARSGGIDADRLAQGLRAWTDDHLNRLPDALANEEADEPWLDDAFAGALRAWMALRARQVVTLQQDVLALTRAAGLRTASNLAEEEDGVNGGAVAAIRAQVDELRVRVLPGMDVGDIAEAVARARRGARDGVPVYAFYQLGHFRTEAAFTGAVERAAAAGLAHHRFYELSLLSGRQLEWLGAAQRLWGVAG